MWSEREAQQGEFVISLSQRGFLGFGNAERFSALSLQRA